MKTYKVTFEFDNGIDYFDDIVVVLKANDTKDIAKKLDEYILKLEDYSYSITEIVELADNEIILADSKGIYKYIYYL